MIRNIIINTLGLALALLVFFWLVSCGTEPQPHEITAQTVAPTTGDKVCPVDWRDNIIQ